MDLKIIEIVFSKKNKKIISLKTLMILELANDIIL